ncbi:hypothetical protein BDZ90DRAFT_188230 [Jaminaea rosea]|uniref:Uncharacterized protein n=1 Tax=Jaminaea rosea TaxID=1569628 RepID=A0A316USB2_9BASI|nr:hypothetical protein BDZ90DRAFT_188230 [Jaminaea rosea]PWN27211.1 hypothetical protein BDZ90DRAFT_188230 [Jaminaea rosea]
MRLCPLHDTVERVLEQVELRQFELSAGAVFPDFLFPVGSPYVPRGYQHSHDQCVRDALPKLETLRKTILEHVDRIGTIKAVYGIWILRHISTAIFTYSFKQVKMWWLLAFDKQELAQLIVRWAEGKRSVRKTRIRDVFTRKDFRRMRKESAAAGEIFLRWKRDNPEKAGEKSVRWQGKRKFLKEWARQAVNRTSKKRNEDPGRHEKEVQRLFEMTLLFAVENDAFCYLCGVELTFERRARKDTKGKKHPKGVGVTSTNFSPDRIVPGTIYDPVTNRPCCLGCNFIKSGYPESTARHLFQAFADASHLLSSGDKIWIAAGVDSEAASPALGAAGDKIES